MRPRHIELALLPGDNPSGDTGAFERFCCSLPLRRIDGDASCHPFHDVMIMKGHNWSFASSKTTELQVRVGGGSISNWVLLSYKRVFVHGCSWRILLSWLVPQGVAVEVSYFVVH